MRVMPAKSHDRLGANNITVKAIGRSHAACICKHARARLLLFRMLLLLLLLCLGFNMTCWNPLRWLRLVRAEVVATDGGMVPTKFNVNWPGAATADVTRLHFGICLILFVLLKQEESLAKFSPA